MPWRNRIWVVKPGHILLTEAGELVRIVSVERSAVPGELPIVNFEYLNHVYTDIEIDLAMPEQ